MPKLIANLSMLHSLDSAHTSAHQEFAKLCRFAPRCCPGQLFEFQRDLLWVAWQEKWVQSGLIDSYKRGDIDTPEFLRRLETIFPFLRDLDPARIGLLNLKETEHYSEDVVYSLLEEAWNAIITMDDLHMPRLAKLMQKAETTPVYLVSNSNELNVLKILRLLKETYPQIKENLDLSVTTSQEPVEIAPNIFLCLSYRYRAFKNQPGLTTMGLIEQLVAGENPNDIQVVSQWPADLTTAKNLGIPSKNLQSADGFFADVRSSFDLPM